jgi:hypothetical protein
MLGRKFCEGIAAGLASTLHSHGPPFCFGGNGFVQPELPSKRRPIWLALHWAQTISCSLGSESLV